MYRYILTEELKQFLYLYYPWKVALIELGSVQEYVEIEVEFFKWYNENLKKE